MPKFSESEFMMPMGEYKGKPISVVPDERLEYYIGWKELNPNTRKIFRDELFKRTMEGTHIINPNRDMKGRLYKESSDDDF